MHFPELIASIHSHTKQIQEYIVNRNLQEIYLFEYQWKKTLSYPMEMQRLFTDLKTPKKLNSDVI